MKTVEAVIGRWPEIFEYYKLPPITGKKHYQGECPICGKKGKFRIDNKNGRGTWICSCGAGDGWKLLELTQQKDFRVLASEIESVNRKQLFRPSSTARKIRCKSHSFKSYRKVRFTNPT